MLKEKLDLLKEKISNDPKSYYKMRLNYHEALLKNLEFQVVENVNDPKLDKDIRRVSRKITYYNNQLNKCK